MPKALTIEEKVAKVDSAIARKTTDRPVRSKRTSFNGTEQKLAVNSLIEGYHLHTFNDTPGRIDKALSAGYEFVSQDEVGGVPTNVVSRNTDIGDKVRYLVGTDGNNNPQYAFLMKLRQEFYEEDQNALQAKNDKIDKAIRGGKLTKEGQSTEGFYTNPGDIKMST